jgi:carbon monoxide dehydrogenase subunit G
MKVSESISINATPEQVWRIGGDVAHVSDWVPVLESSYLDGDIRHAVFAGGGGSARERIVEIDDVARFYVYEYLDGPLALESYVSRFAVEAEDGGCARVTWSSELSAGTPEVEAELAAAISGIYAAALAELAVRATA